MSHLIFKPKMMSYKILIPLLFINFFISCTSDDTISEEKIELSQARQKWNSAQIKNYEMHERLSCFCGGLLEWDVFVKNGIKDKVEYDESQAFGQTYDDIFDQARTIEDVFDFLEGLLDRELASLIVEYDDVYGFPKLISIDYVENIADDEIAYFYTEFEIEN
jgi:hypothetical protein